MLHHVIAHGHLAIGDKHHLVLLAHAQYRGAVHLWTFRAITHPHIIAPRMSQPKWEPPAALWRNAWSVARPQRKIGQGYLGREFPTPKFRGRRGFCSRWSAATSGSSNCCTGCHCLAWWD